MNNLNAAKPQDLFSDILGGNGVTPFPISNLAIALDLARRGFAVFPCRPDNKAPLIKGGFQHASRDPDQVNGWWQRWPGAIVGLPCGRVNGIAVLDLDRHSVEQDGIAALAGLGVDPATASPISVTTPSDGLHLYYRWPSGLTCTAHHLPDGIDIRAQGGYVIAPGSAMRDGRRYGSAVIDMEALPEFPDMLKPPARSLDDELDDLVKQGSADSEPFDPARVAEMLTWIDPDEEYQVWLSVGMALHHGSQGSDAGFALFQEWSARGTKYKGERDCRAKWRSFRDKPGAATMGTLIHMARERGHDPHELSDSEFEDYGPEPGEEASADLFVPASQWLGKPVPEREWLVPNLIPNRVVTLLTGDGGTGKSLLALQLGVAVARAEKWIGQKVDRPGKVLFLTAEDEADELHRRLNDICAGDLAGLDNLLVKSVVDTDPLLATFDKQNKMKTTALFRQVKAAAEAARPSLIVLDTLANLHSGNENDKAHAMQFVNALKGMASRLGCAVVLLMHPSLTGMANGSGSAGSVGWTNNVRSRLFLARIKDSDGTEPDSNARTLTTTKANYGPQGDAVHLQWNRGKFVAPGIEFDDLDPDETREAKAERVFLNLLDRFTREGRYVSPNLSSTYAPKLFSAEPDADRCGKSDLAGAMSRLFIAQRISMAQHNSKGKLRVHIERNQNDDINEARE